MESNKTATQRIEDLEKGLMSTFQVVEMMTKDILTLKDAVKLLNNKLDAVVKNSKSGLELSEDNIGAHMIANNVAELKAKVDSLVAQGILSPGDTVTDNSFIVGREIDSTGQVVNPRLQVVFSALTELAKAKLIGAKVGDLIEIEEGKLKLELMETFSIVQPDAPSAESATAVEATAPALEAEVLAPAAE